MPCSTNLKMWNSQMTEELGGKNVKISVNPANQVGYQSCAWSNVRVTSKKVVLNT